MLAELQLTILPPSQSLQSAHAAPTHRTKGTSLSFGSSAGRSSGSNNYIGDFDFETLLRSSETRKVSLTPSRFAQAGEGDEADVGAIRFHCLLATARLHS